ncbi:GntR family transcriptional regulator [Gymnodinialimonas hymeniacidonis]|uniref:GntR family transcriptional regulator n=1 Tax=Gymnodinialimonas hymeniacidonis TaxID=3126508 RepID=UPI0034C68EB2
MTITDYLRNTPPFAPGRGPRYVQLRDRLSTAMAQGILAPGSVLPSEREIGNLTDLSRVTVRKAIQDLVARGDVVQKQGSGSFVTEKAERFQQSLSRLTSFSEEMGKRGLQTSVRMLEQSICLPSAEEIAALNLPDDASVSRLARLRLADDRPLAVERSSLPTDILANPMQVTASLYEVLDRNGTRPIRATQRISAVNLNAADAGLLGVPDGAAGLHIERLSYLASGRVAELTKSIFRGDAYDFVVELNQ